MLMQCNLTVHTDTVAEKDIADLIAREFAEKPACALLETTREAHLLPLAELDLESVLPTCLKLIISNATKELRIEADAAGFTYRLLTEEAGEDYRIREDTLFLRKSAAIHPEIAKSRGMRNREYFKEDEDGMYVFFADRLAGCAN
ncbi:MAG: hypothetical protein IJU76_04145 [Desulfovibrionaceae bacterium]|nr:hypothetical protein [Desulfovibrionaceae bacterium]